MSDFYCPECKRTTTHKKIMCKNQVCSESPIGQFFNSLGQIFRGTHYHQMEEQLFCRECNCQKLDVKMPEKSISTAINAH